MFQTAFVVYALFSCSVAMSASPLSKTVTLNNGVDMTTVNLGTCCGSDPKIGLEPWLKAGGVGIDTAYNYNDQQDIGRILEDKSVPRDSIFITTKLPGGFNTTDCAANDPTIAVRYAQENAKQLGVDYVDLLLLHFPCSTPEGNVAMWKGMVDAMSSNFTRAIGVSNFNADQLDALPAPVPAVNQCMMGVNQHDDATIAYCQKKGIQYEAFFVMHNCPFADSRIITIATAHNVSASQVCQRYVLDKGVVMAVGTGNDPVKSTTEAAENLDVFGWHLSAAEFKIVDNIQNATTIV